MNVQGSVVLITGANRGIGAEFVKGLRARGASKIYAAARDAQSISAESGVVPISLDVTNKDQVAAAAVQAGDVQILINNAGLALPQPVVGGDIDKLREEFEVNVFGPLALVDAFAPILKANGGGTVVNALSVLSWLSFPGVGGYSASKSAAWNLTDAMRLELAGQGTTVLGYHMGPVATAMGDNFPLDKINPEQVVNAVLDGIDAGASEVIVDDLTKFVRSTLSEDPSRYAKIFGGGS